MTPQDVLTDVRRLIQDESTPYRYNSTTLLGFVNQTIRRMVLLRPDLFTTVTTIATTPNVSEQSLPATASRLVEIFRVQNGGSIEEVDRVTFDRVYPNWTTDAAGIPTKYIRHPRNPRAYFLYPRPSAGIILIGEYVVTPPIYGNLDPITVLPDSYFSSLVDGTVYLAESVDNEHVSSGRAKLFYDSFAQSLAVDLQGRVVTDTENAGMK